MKFKLLAAVAAATVFAASADAAILRYDLQGTVPNKFTLRFELDTTRAPSTSTSQGLRYNGVALTYTLPGSTTPITENGQFDGVTFQVLNNQGGLFAGFLEGAPNNNNRVQVFGPELFSGSTSSPTMLTGVFLLSDIQRQRITDPLQVNYRLTVTDVTPGAVPEPASWAMLIAGVGMVGGAMRRRQVRVLRPA
ncbi:PEPxxWA-CTERM sorting domain-containing protein [uncultured Sphingomonas sp.]|uniref:PEPxxWA-CTERM sorting domain-containing protein n=1 Tax=uncultured Sphingomonas sp. TaxID=158754 RepID=UPI0035CB870A